MRTLNRQLLQHFKVQVSPNKKGNSYEKKNLFILVKINADSINMVEHGAKIAFVYILFCFLLDHIDISVF